MKKLKVSPALVVAVIALVVACAGSATAASLITGAQIKNGTVTGADVRNKSLTGKDVKPRSLVARHLRGRLPVASLSSEAVDELQQTIVTTRVAASVSIGAFNRAEASVECPEGQVATGGGGELIERPWLGEIRRSAPILDGAGIPRGWTIWMFNGGTGGQSDQARVYAICSP